MPRRPLVPQNYGGRWIQNTTSMPNEPSYLIVINAPDNQDYALRIICFDKDREAWEKAMRDMATDGHEWSTFTPVVTQPVERIMAFRAPNLDDDKHPSPSNRVELLVNDD